MFKEGGYDSDSTLVFKRREGSDLSLEDPKMAYKIIQRGGDIPLHGLRKPAPNKPKGTLLNSFFLIFNSNF